MCSQALSEDHPLSSITSDSASAYGEQEGYSEQGGTLDGGKHRNEMLQCSVSTQHEHPHVFDGNQVRLVFSHLEPTRGETVSISCGGCVPASCGMELSRYQVCQSCGERHILTADGSCLAASSVSEAEMLVDSLQSLSMSPTGVASGNQHFDNSAAERSVVPAPEDSCGAASTVSGGPTHWVWSHRYSSGHASRALCHSCRAEVMRVDYLDDVTVDELAGYFDQLLYLPRPMSEMAELMYT